MLIRFSTAAALTAAFLCTSFLAQTATAQEGGGYKIGVVDVQRVLADYNKRDSKYRQLEQEVERLQRDVDVISQRIEDNRSRLEQGRGTLSDDELFNLRQQIDRDVTEYRAELEKRQREIDRQEELVLREVIEDVDKAIATVAKQGNYHLILNAKGSARSAVLYHDTTIEITSQVLALLNQ